MTMPHTSPASSVPPAWSLRRLHTLDESHIKALADVLLDCVEGGASVSFMHPLPRERAVAFWSGVVSDVAAGRRALLVAEDAHGICGTVQLLLDQPDNQPHRADLAKMLVHRRARRQGLGAALMRTAESTARECGKTLLVLDAVTDGDAPASTNTSAGPASATSPTTPSTPTAASAARPTTTARWISNSVLDSLPLPLALHSSSSPTSQQTEGLIARSRRMESACDPHPEGFPFLLKPEGVFLDTTSKRRLRLPSHNNSTPRNTPVRRIASLPHFPLASSLPPVMFPHSPGGEHARASRRRHQRSIRSPERLRHHRTLAQPRRIPSPRPTRSNTRRYPAPLRRRIR